MQISLIPKHINNVLFMILLSTYSTRIQARETIQIAVDSENPPFMFQKNNSAEGLYPRLIKKLFANLPYDVKIEALPWKRALYLLDEGKVAVAGIYKNNERLKKYEYTDQIFVEKILIYAQKNKAIHFDSITDLKNYKIGVIRGWSYGQEFDDAVTRGLISIEENNSDQLNFKKLVIGRLDAVIAVEESAKLALKRSEFAASVRALDKPLTVNATYIAFKKQNTNNALIKAINQQIKIIDIKTIGSEILEEFLISAD